MPLPPYARLRTPVGLDDVLDGASADGTARVVHLLQLEAAGVAEAHVATGVEHRVHRVLVADGALCVAPPRRRRWRWHPSARWEEEGGGLRAAEGRGAFGGARC